MGILDRLFGRWTAGPGARNEPVEQAVIVRLDGASLTDEILAEQDLATLEERLVEALSAAGVGEYDGHEIGPEEATIYMYGADAEALYSAVEPILHASPLCRNARVEVRLGGPGAPQRELRLPAA